MPAPTPLSLLITSVLRAGGNNQNLKLFSRGYAISLLLIIMGTNQFPNPPRVIGIIKKKIITNAWAVTTLLYSWSLPKNEPGDLNSSRTTILNPVPTAALHIPK